VALPWCVPDLFFRLGAGGRPRNPHGCRASGAPPYSTLSQGLQQFCAGRRRTKSQLAQLPHFSDQNPDISATWPFFSH
jgi:hypothetical protein